MGQEALFIRCIDDEDKGPALLASIRDESSERRFHVDQAKFSMVPGTPLAYWVSDRIRSVFETNPSLGSRWSIDMGMSTKNDFRFVRLWWEVLPGDIGWSKKYRWYAKGLDSETVVFSPKTVVLSEGDFEQLTEELLHKYPYLEGNADWVLHPEYHYGHPGLTFGRRVRRFSPSPLPSGVVFSDSNPSIFGGSSEELLVLAAYLRSPIVQSLLGLLAPPRKMEVKFVSRIPVPTEFSAETKKVLLARSSELFLDGLIALSNDETEVHFREPRFSKFEASTSITATVVDEHIAQALNLDPENVNELMRVMSEVTGLKNATAQPTPETSAHRFERLFSYGVGLAFHRFSAEVRDRDMGSNTYEQLFSEPSPTHATILWKSDDATASGGQSVRSSIWPSERNSGVGLQAEVFRQLDRCLRAKDAKYPTTSTETLERCEVYLSQPNQFFDDHLKEYSIPNRKAPIYWPLSTPSGSYILWVYYPRLTDQTLNSCIADFIDPKLEQDVRPEIDRLRRKQDLSSADRKQLDTLVDLERELTDMRSELERVTKLPYKPNLNDGVIICAAPLWKLFQHKGWQKDLKQCWKDLESGKYDWAHLAYAIWPQRVEQKCREDKSIAIAHNRRDLLGG